MEIIGYIVFLLIGFYAGYRIQKPTVLTDLEKIQKIFDKPHIKVFSKKAPLRPEEEVETELQKKITEGLKEGN